MIRRAVPDDALVLARERFALRAALDPVIESGQEFVARCRAWMASRLAEPGGAWRCWVAEESGEIVGTIWLMSLEKLPNPVGEPEKHGYVSSFHVSPARRGGGLGSGLLSACLKVCDDENFDAVILWPTPRSRELYLRHGFAPDEVLLSRRR